MNQTLSEKSAVSATASWVLLLTTLTVIGGVAVGIPLDRGHYRELFRSWISAPAAH